LEKRVDQQDVFRSLIQRGKWIGMTSIGSRGLLETGVGDGLSDRFVAATIRTSIFMSRVPPAAKLLFCNTRKA
jgi:hypothetical protein